MVRLRVNADPARLKIAFDHRTQRYSSFEDFAQSYVSWENRFADRDPTLRERMLAVATEIWDVLHPEGDVWSYSTMSPNHPLSGQAGYLAIFNGVPTAMIITMYS